MTGKAVSRSDAERMQEARRLWDEEAGSFDDAPDHGLNDPRVRRAWAEILMARLPAERGAVLDAGCGTGSLSVLMAGMGHRVTGIDASPAILDRAREKAGAQGYTINFHLMDAAAPQFPPETFDVVVCRHVLWTLPEPARVLERWARLLRPGGRLVLIEGYWSTGAGLHAADVVAALPASLAVATIEILSDQPILWGKQVSDERYLVVAKRLV